MKKTTIENALKAATMPNPVWNSMTFEDEIVGEKPYTDHPAIGRLVAVIDTLILQFEKNTQALKDQKRALLSSITLSRPDEITREWSEW